MDWNDLKFVLAVSRARSYQAAAALLKVSHTTVSRRIAAVENDLATPLFKREGNRALPTVACEALLLAAGRVESEIQSIRHEVSTSSSNPEGPVQITTMPWIINHLLVPHLSKLCSDYPGVRISMVGDVIDGDDYGSNPVVSLRFDYQARRHESEMVVGSFGYALYGPADHRQDDLPWVSFNSGRLPTAPAYWLEKRGVQLKDVALLGNDAEIVRNAIRAGIGKGLIPEVLGEGDPMLRRLSGKDPEIVRHLRALTEHRNLTLPAVKVVLEWLSETVGAFSVRSGKTGRRR